MRTFLDSEDILVGPDFDRLSKGCLRVETFRLGCKVQFRIRFKLGLV